MEQRAGFDYVNDLYAPLRQQGSQASTTLQNIAGLNGRAAQQGWYDDYVMSPDVAARVKYGTQAIDNSSAARTGGVLSGGLLKRLQQFGTDQATGDINNKIGLIERISNTGNNAIGATANARLGLSNNLASSFMNEGNQMANASLADGAFLNSIIGGATRLAGATGWNPFQRQPVAASSTTYTDPWAGYR